MILCCLPAPIRPATTLIGSSITINGGSVGAYKLVQTTGNATINSNIFSADKIILTNSNIVKGDISAAANYPNLPLSTGTILSVGSSASITGAKLMCMEMLSLEVAQFRDIVTIPANAHLYWPEPGKQAG